MKAIRSIFILMSTALLITSCDMHPNRTIIGTGDVETMEVDVPAFTGVSVTGTCDVEIRTGETQMVELSAQQEVLDVMTYQVRGGILHIGFKPDYNVNTEERYFSLYRRSRN